MCLYMTYKEKAFYHQLHPLKISVDIISSLIAIYFLWYGNTTMGLIIGLIPTFFISAIFMIIGKVESYKIDRLRTSVENYVSLKTQIVRTLGFILLALGIGERDYLMMLSGAFLLVPAWVWVIFLHYQVRKSK